MTDDFQHVRWELLRPAAMESRINELPVVYLPFGSLEWHGLHNPLGLDAVKAHALCLHTAARHGGVVAPPTFWPIGGLQRPWTVRMSPELIRPLMVAAFEQMAHVGFRTIIAVTGHYGVEQVVNIKDAAVDVMLRSGVTVYALPEYEAADGTGYRGDHAAKWETSLMQYLLPDLVDMSAAEPPGQPMDGVFGDDPRLHASRELGKRTAETIIEHLGIAAKRLAAAVPADRSAFIEACASQRDVLKRLTWEAFRHEPYWTGVAALCRGEYAAAAAAFRSIPVHAQPFR